jgi:hypothetical protein
VASKGPPVLIQQALQLCSDGPHALTNLLHVSPGSCNAPALGTGFRCSVDGGKFELTLCVQGDHDVDKPVEPSIPGGETGGGVHGRVGHEERRGETEAISEHCLVKVPRQLLLFLKDLDDVLTIIGRGRRFLRYCRGCLLRFKKDVRQAMRSDDLD